MPSCSESPYQIKRATHASVCEPYHSRAVPAEHGPPHLGQQVGHLVEQLVRLVGPARGFGTASRLALSLFPICDAGEQRVMSGTDVTWLLPFCPAA
jgi:hypothetical protein